MDPTQNNHTFHCGTFPPMKDGTIPEKYFVV